MTTTIDIIYEFHELFDVLQQFEKLDITSNDKNYYSQFVNKINCISRDNDYYLNILNNIVDTKFQNIQITCIDYNKYYTAFDDNCYTNKNEFINLLISELNKIKNDLLVYNKIYLITKHYNSGFF